MAIIYCQEGEFEQGIIVFKRVLKETQQSPFIQNNEVVIRITFNLAKMYFQQGNYGKSKHFCRKGLSLCEELQTLYLIGELLYQKAECLEIEGAFNRAKELFIQARSIFKINKSESYCLKSDQKITKVENEIAQKPPIGNIV